MSGEVKKYCIIRVPQLVAFSLLLSAVLIWFGYIPIGDDLGLMSLGIVLVALLIMYASDRVNKKLGYK